MPPQVGRARDGAGPVATNAGEGVQEIKSAEVEKKSTEPQKDAPKNETAAQYRATPKEASNKKGEMDAGAAAQKSQLDRQLKEKEGKIPNVIRGTSGNDNVHVSKADGLLGKLGLYEVDVNGSKQYLTKQQLSQSEIRTGAGNDTVVVDSNVKVGINVDGGSGNDVIIGGGGDDKLSGGGGNDVIAGRNGNDVIKGGKGDDYLSGGKGHDTIEGGRGKDYIQGGRGNDVIKGGQGFDLIDGGPGYDRIKNGNRK